MQRHTRTIVFMLCACAALCGAFPAQAAQELREFDGAPFSVAAQRQMAVQLLPLESESGHALAAALPQDILGIDILQFRWPKSDRVLELAISRREAVDAGGLRLIRSDLVYRVGDGPAQQLALAGPELDGFISRLCVWPSNASDSAQLILLLSYGSSGPDSPVVACGIGPDGVVQPVETRSAMTLFGWFEATDLDDDGDYELITTRSLDRVDGGFTYHAIRAYDAAQGGYVPAPAGYHDYYQAELEFLSWVVDTRQNIQADPGPYLNTDPAGQVYVANYNGNQIAFDSLIELPATFTGVSDLPGYNQDRRVAFQRVRAYRDELQSWLNGGVQPATWLMPQ
jgi:hypothetical protein